MDAAVVQKHGMVQAGSVVGSGKVIKSGQLWGGVPAAFIRDLSVEEKQNIRAGAAANAEWAKIHATEGSKTWETIRDEVEDFEQESERAPYYYQRLSEEAKSFKLGEIENHQVPGRVFDSEVIARPAQP
jgi:hypothetical protein